jgi:acyl dehydratase
MPSIKDIEGLQALVTDEWSDWTDSVEITQEMVNTFADVTKDHQWIHIDEERSAAGPFGTTIVHGFFTMSLVAYFGGQMGPKIDGVMGGLNYGGDKYRFLAPVPVGSKLHARGRITSVTQKSSGVLMKREIAVHAEGNETPALLVETLTLLLG